VSRAAAVREALARLREAGALLRQRTAADVHAALADVLDAWSAPGSPLAKSLAEALPTPTGFAQAAVAEGLACGLAPYTGAALRDLIRSELGGAERIDAGLVAGFDTTAVVLAGAIPLPTFVAVLAPLALRSPVLVKTPAPDPLTAPALARSLAERDPLLGACVEAVDFRRDDAEAMAALCESPCVAATGSDEAVAAIGARVRPSQRFLGSGHRFSLVLLGPGATRGPALADAAARLARDFALWDQLGCLSPVSVHAVGAEPATAGRVAEALAGALADAESRWPRGRIDAATAAAIARARDEASLRGASLRAPEGTAWSVVCERDPALRPSPLHRFARVHPAESVDAALGAIAPHAARLAGVAVAGFGAATADLAEALAALGASRVCAPGALQTPPLAWPRDGRPVLLSLARLASVEVG
jgi:hypothetical protein